MEGVIKYLFCYNIEKLHRYCFDALYLQDYKIKFQDKIVLRLFDLCCYLIPDYREYLRKWHDDNKTKYLRYKCYN